MALPTITPLPAAPSRSEGPAAFNLKADPFIAALPPFVLQANLLAVAINEALASIATSVQAAALSATAANDSAVAANNSKVAAQQAVIDAGQAGAAQVALAVAAKNEAQAAAIAAGAGAGIPGQRTPFTVLGITSAGALAFMWGIPDTSVGKTGQSVMLAADKKPYWGYSGQQIGDTLITSRAPGSLYLPADGSIRLQSAYPTLFAQVGLIGGNYIASWAQVTVPFSSAMNAVESGANGTTIAFTGSTSAYRSLDKGLTWQPIVLPANGGLSIATDGIGTWIGSILGSSGQCLVSVDDGLTWTAKATPGTVAGNPNAVTFVGLTVFLLLGESGLIYRTANANQFTTVASGYGSTLQSIGANGSGTVLISYLGSVRKSTNYGQSFSDFMTPNGQIFGISSDGAGNWLMGGQNTNTNMYKSINDAVSFELFPMAAGLTLSVNRPITYYDNSFFFITSAALVYAFNKNTNVYAQKASVPVASGVLKSAGAGVFLSQGTANSISRSVPTYTYDPSTQFALPNLSPQAPVGTKSYIKALEAA